MLMLLIISSLTRCLYTILLYIIDISIIRSIETYQSSLSYYYSVRVYFFMYEGSTEEHRYVSSLSKEKTAFESLIKSKEHMVISLPDDPIDLQHEMEQDNKHSTISMDTRTIHRSNQQKSKESRRIIVDVREFRSLLPSMLYSAKFEILPRTLEVADYVLSSDICVERKGKKEGMNGQDPW